MMTNNKKKSFSQKLLVQESILVWIITLSFLVLAFYSVVNNYLGNLPWLTGMITCTWAAYGVSQAFYYKKAEKENTVGGITYQNMIHEHDLLKANESNENPVSIFGTDGYKDENDINLDTPIC